MDADVQKLASLEDELRKDLEAIARVRQLIAAKNGALAAKPDDRQYPLLIAGDRASDHVDSTDADDAPVESLRGKIEQVINSDPTVRWTTQKMLSHLQAIGFPLRARKPIYSVGQAMQKLGDSQKIRLIRRGVGSAPNIYRGLNPVVVVAEPDKGGDSQGGDIVSESTVTE